MMICYGETVAGRSKAPDGGIDRAINLFFLALGTDERLHGKAIKSINC
jgi:hypothetical protein